MTQHKISFAASLLCAALLLTGAGAYGADEYDAALTHPGRHVSRCHGPHLHHEPGPFQNLGPNQPTVDPQQRAGVQIGVEQIAWEKPSTAQRVTVEVRVRMDHHFFGRSHSELWEALSGSPQCANDATKCRSDPSTPGGTFGIDYDAGRAAPYPGVTETQAYSTFGGDAGLNIQVGRYARFRGLFGMTLDSPHFVTYAVTGVDRNNNGTVELNDPNEKNPAYRATIDNAGRRFRVEGTQVWSLLLEGSLMF